MLMTRIGKRLKLADFKSDLLKKYRSLHRSTGVPPIHIIYYTFRLINYTNYFDFQ